MNGKTGKVLLLILGLALLTKLAAWGFITWKNPIYFAWPDSFSYHNSAVALLETGYFAVDAEHPEVPMVERTPGYPLFLAGIYAIFGVNFPVPIFIQILLNTAVLLFTFLLARKYWNETVGMGALVFLFFNFIFFVYTLKLLTETLFCILLLGMIWCGLKVIGNKGEGWWGGLGGLFLAGATMVRPIGYYLIFLLPLGLLVGGIISRWKWKAVALSALLFLLPNIIIIGGWEWRNYRATGNLVFSAIENYNLLMLHGGNIIAESEGIPRKAAQRRLIEEYLQGVEVDGTSAEYYQLCNRDNLQWRKDAVGIIKRHPGIFARNYAAGLFKILFVPGFREPWCLTAFPDDKLTSTFFQAPPLLLGIIFAVFIYNLILYWGIAKYLKHAIKTRSIRLEDIFILSIIAYLILVSGGPVGQMRFLYPIMPFLALYSAKGFLQNKNYFNS